jgi:hypothetical protein
MEAALCLAGKLAGVEGHFSEQVLQTAHERFHGRIGLQELLLEAAWANGYTGRTFRSDMRGVLMAAFSTFSLPGILSNTANKFLLQAFNAVESNWRAIAAVRSVTDFKQVTSHRLVADLMYEEVGADGELKHGKVSEEEYAEGARVHRRGFEPAKDTPRNADRTRDRDVRREEPGADARSGHSIGRALSHGKDALAHCRQAWTAALRSPERMAAAGRNLIDQFTSAWACDACLCTDA